MANAKKVALITGANKGLGYEMAKQLGQAGVTVVLAARDKAKGEKAAETLKAEGLDVRFLKLDVTNKKDYAEAAAYLEKNFGKLDILINNAGISADGLAGTSASATTEQSLKDTFETNFFSVVALTQALLPLLRKAPAGRIVNLSSVLGSLTRHSDPSSAIYGKKAFAYDASKTALNAFTVHLAHDLRGTKIKVNSAHPGWVQTEMGGTAAPLDVADGGKTSVQLATLPDDGPTGGYFHLGEALPW